MMSIWLYENGVKACRVEVNRDAVMSILKLGPKYYGPVKVSGNGFYAEEIHIETLAHSQVKELPDAGSCGQN